ncbi:phage tail protein [Escherichia coli]|uniref:phage tail fiber protein n=1 Tax=Escherichia coli TaxID=562 RepID=UPI00241149F1|nr:phage tail protein [Escherichia coli]
MSAGTLTLTNNNSAVTGSGTAFTTDLSAGDFIVITVGGVPYTLAVRAVNSNTSVSLVSNYTGPTLSSAAWNAVPRVAMNLVTTALVVQSTEALRGLNYDKQNWQQVFSGAGDITVTMPDGTQYSGPSWPSIVSSVSGKLSSDATTLRKLFTAAFVNPGDNWPYPGVTTYNNNLWGSPSKWGTVLTLSNQNVSGNGAEGRWYSYLQIDTYGNFAVAANINNQFFGIYRVWTTKNTTVDGSGFIKRASPIARLVADTSIMSREFTDSFKISGSGAVNEEAEGVDIEKLGDGRYRISGSDGLAQDGWQIEVPKDINGNRLCFVEVTEGLDGILLKVFKPKLDLETGGIIAGESFDIPEGRWIDVRLQMPASSAYNVVQGKIAGKLESKQMAG